MVAALVAEDTRTRVVNLSEVAIDPTVVEMVPYDLAKQYTVLPLNKKGRTLTIAMADTYDVVAVDTVERATGYQIDVVTAPAQAIREAIERNYLQGGSINDLVEALLKQGLHTLGEEAGGEASMIRLCNQIIARGVQRRATDIHFEPDEKILRVRLRIDGILHQEALIPKELQAPVLARIKIMASLNVTEKRVPQDGRIGLSVGAKAIDLRVSTLPTSFGESIVLRILDKSTVNLELTALGFPVRYREDFRTAIERPHGLMLVTGPTGSGKTTTLYTALSMINAGERSVFTLEDPIEYELPLIRQTQVHPDLGMTFSTGLRSLLRQDPDVILVGEIRDQETAKLAFQAALTGHLVLSTLHTNDAVGAIPRLIDMGVEPFLVATALRVIIAQRLVRCLCSECHIDGEPTDLVFARFHVPLPDDAPPRFKRGTGCAACSYTGYHGRQGLYEVLFLDERFHYPIVKSDVPTIMGLAERSGMQKMFHYGLEFALRGGTTVEEVLRVVGG